jgi:hypothetical protein
MELNWITSCKLKKRLYHTQELNLRQIAYKAIALPTELVCKLFRLGHEVQITVWKVDSQ